MHFAFTKERRQSPIRAHAHFSLASPSPQDYDLLPSELWCKLEAERPSGPSLQGVGAHWPYMVTLELGTYLVDLMVKNLKIDSDILNPACDRKRIPILYHMYTFRSMRQVHVHVLCQVRAIDVVQNSV